jgi:hypothetical protein
LGVVGVASVVRLSRIVATAEKRNTVLSGGIGSCCKDRESVEACVVLAHTNHVAYTALET